MKLLETVKFLMSKLNYYKKEVSNIETKISSILNSDKASEPVKKQTPKKKKK